MNLDAKRINSLKVLLKELGLDLTDEQAQEAGLAIMRFALAKFQRTNKSIKGDH
jgi:hypothetical protein